MDEFVTTAIALKKDNPQPANFSGFWLPGQDWRNGVTFIWDAGGDLAVQDGDEWKGSLSSPESVAGLTTVQKLFEEASGAAKDGNEANPEVPFCNNEIGMFSAPGWQARRHQHPGHRLPEDDEEPRSVRAARLGRLACSSAARRVEHRRRREVAEPGPREEGRRPDAQ